MKYRLTSGSSLCHVDCEQRPIPGGTRIAVGSVPTILGLQGHAAGVSLWQHRSEIAAAIEHVKKSYHQVLPIGGVDALLYTILKLFA
jgi:hypothetical protein